MTKEDIIRMAIEAGWDAHHAEFDTRIQTFAVLVAQYEREACIAHAMTSAEKRTWVGLTYEEKHEIRYSHMTSAEFIEFIEAKLKEKNTRGQE